MLYMTRAMTTNFPRFLEPLEERIAPAMAAWSTTGSYSAYSYNDWDSSNSLALVPTGETIDTISQYDFQDVDGDEVSIKFSKPVSFLSSYLDDFIVRSPGAERGEKLEAIDLGLVFSHSELRHLGISITAKQAGGGDGFVDVGSILGDGIDMGHVVVDGALGRITAGDSKVSTSGLLSLEVHSLGLADGSEPTDLSSITSVIVGSLNSLTVTGNIDKALLSIAGSDKAGLGSAKIGGSLIGGDADYSGAISVEGQIGKIWVGGNLEGGAGKWSGSIFSGEKISSVTVDGDVVGGDGTDGYSGVVYTNGKIAYATVGGNLEGGTGERSGMIHGHTGISWVKVGGDIIGGDGYASGRIETAEKLTTVKVCGDIVGGTANYAGSVMSMETIRSISVGGNLEGGDTKGSGSIFSEEGITRVIVQGDLQGGSGEGSGCVEAADKIFSVRVDGDLTGSTGDKSGSVLSFGGKIRSVDHNGDSLTGAGTNSGVFYAPYTGGSSTGSSGSYVSYGSSGATFVLAGDYGYGSGDWGLSVVGSGSSDSTPTGSGTLTLAGDNTYSGSTTVNSGTLTSGGTGDTGGISGTGGAVVTVGGFLSYPTGGLSVSAVGFEVVSSIAPGASFETLQITNIGLEAAKMGFYGDSTTFLSGTLKLSGNFLASTEKTLTVSEGVTVILPNGATLPAGSYTGETLAAYFLPA